MNPAIESLPQHIKRLFPHTDLTTIAKPENRPFLIAKLLEEGERDDLRWLIEQIGEDALKTWLKQQGGRSLSRRSRFFWEWVLDEESGLKSESREALWPL